jgi:hypothetical protein
MRTAVELGVPDCVRHGVWVTVPQATKWQRIGNQMDAAFIFARADFVTVLVSHGRRCVSRGSEAIQTSRICIAPSRGQGSASKLENR